MTPKRYVWISEPGTDGRIWTVLPGQRLDVEQQFEDSVHPRAVQQDADEPAMGAPVGDSDLSQHADAVASEASATLERLSAESPEQPS